MKNLVIIGASDAGISAALRVRELAPSIRPVLLTADNFPNFSICGLPYYIGRQVERWQDLAHRTREEIADAGIELLTMHVAEDIDTRSRRVTVQGPAGGRRALDYDRLILATGAVPVRPHIAGLDLPGVFFLRWMTDAFALEEYIESRKPQRALIIGAGYIGMEMSEALARRGLSVTVAESSGSVLPSVDRTFGQRIASVLSDNGVSVLSGTSAGSIEKKGRSLFVKGPGGFEFQADLVLVAAGSAPNTSLGRAAGLGTGAGGAFTVKRGMETGIPGLYAAGDCAQTWHRLLDKHTYLPLGTVAHRQGRIAGENAAGGSRKYEGTVGTQSLKIFDCVVARTGLNEAEAVGAGFEPVCADSEAWDHKAYLPPARKIFLRVIADRPSGRLLGAQVLGSYGTEISKRIDIFATALHHGTTVAAFSDYDLSYTPPLSSPWDPVQAAVQHLERALRPGCR